MCWARVLESRVRFSSPFLADGLLQQGKKNLSSAILVMRKVIKIQNI